MLQYVSVLQCVAVLQSHVWLDGDGTASQCVAVCCSVLQCVAVCCNVLQCVVVCCSVLQYLSGMTEMAQQRERKACVTAATAALCDNAPEISQKLALRS